LGQLRGTIGGLPPNDYVDVLLVDSRVKSALVNPNGSLGPAVVGLVDFWTDGKGSHHAEEFIAVDPKVSVDRIVVRAKSRPTQDMRLFGAPATRC
jgi:hypothetical protein